MDSSWGRCHCTLIAPEALSAKRIDSLVARPIRHRPFGWHGSFGPFRRARLRTSLDRPAESAWPRHAKTQGHAQAGAFPSACDHGQETTIDRMETGWAPVANTEKRDGGKGNRNHRPVKGMRRSAYPPLFPLLHYRIGPRRYRIRKRRGGLPAPPVSRPITPTAHPSRADSTTPTDRPFPGRSPALPPPPPTSNTGEYADERPRRARPLRVCGRPGKRSLAPGGAAVRMPLQRIAGPRASTGCSP